MALDEGLGERAADGAIRASGIAADVTLTDPDSGETTDAVQVELDHADADAVDIYVPYETGATGSSSASWWPPQGREPVFAHGTPRTAVCAGRPRWPAARAS